MNDREFWPEETPGMSPEVWMALAVAVVFDVFLLIVALKILC
jgi:hypothetical protein